MSALALLKHCYLSYFSRPAAERVLYRLVRRHKVGSIVELGIGDGRRAQRLIRAAAAHHPPHGVHYAGIDLFEARPADQPGLTLKGAHRQLSPLADKLRLIPGDPYAALSRMANSLANTDLLIIAADQDQQSLERAWYYVPRMLHENSRVMLQIASAGEEASHYRSLSRDEVEKLASRSQPTRRRAA